MLLEIVVSAKEGRDANQQPKRAAVPYLSKRKIASRSSYRSPPGPLMKPTIANAPEEILRAQSNC